MNNAARKYVQVPLTLHQLAQGLKQLPEEDWEELEMLLDEEFMQTVRERSATAWDEYRSGNTLSLEEVKKELDV